MIRSAQTKKFENAQFGPNTKLLVTKIQGYEVLGADTPELVIFENLFLR